MIRRALYPLMLAGLGALCWYMGRHPDGARFSIGIWPVPQGTPWTYQLLSGFVAALAILSLAGSIIGAYHLHNCHQRGCPRLGKHKISGTPWCTRHKHLAKPQRSVEELLELILAAVSPPE